MSLVPGRKRDQRAGGVVAEHRGPGAPVFGRRLHGCRNLAVGRQHGTGAAGA